MEVGDRKEWYWPNCTKDNFIVVRPTGAADQHAQSSDEESDGDFSDDDKGIGMDSDDGRE